MRADIDAGLLGGRFVEVDKISHGGIEISLGQLQFTDSCKLQKRTEDFVKVSTFLLHSLKLGQHSLIARRVAFLQLFDEKFEIQTDR